MWKLNGVFVQLVVSGVLFGGIYSLVGIGLTLIFGVMDIVNFSQGEYLMLALYAAYWLHRLAGVDPYVAIPLLAILMFGFGLLTERIFIRPTIGKPPSVHIFVTLGLSVMLQNLALLFWGGNFRTVRTPYAEHTVSLSGVLLSSPRLVIFSVAMLVAVGVHLFLHHTWSGRAIRATAQDRHAAALMGIDTRRVYAITFALSSACLGVAAGLLLPLYYVYPTVGFPFTIVGFVAVLMGGLGSVHGAVLASLVIGLVETLSGFLIAPSMKQAVYFAVFILTLILRPVGLFGRRMKVA